MVSIKVRLRKEFDDLSHLPGRPRSTDGKVSAGYHVVFGGLCPVLLSYNTGSKRVSQCM